MRKHQDIQQSKSVHELSKIRNLNEFPLPVNIRLPDVPLPKVSSIVGVIARVPKKKPRKPPGASHFEPQDFSICKRKVGTMSSIFNFTCI